MEEYITSSAEETKKLAEKLAHLTKGGVIALIGNLGSGKTTFVQGFAKTLGIKDRILSPTFIIVREHQIPKRGVALFHIDLYRMDKVEDLTKLGIDELWENPQNFILIEWAEKMQNLLPPKTTWIYFENLENDKRRIVISPHPL